MAARPCKQATDGIKFFLDNVHILPFRFLELGYKKVFNGNASYPFSKASCGSNLIRSTRGIGLEALKFLDVFPLGKALLDKLLGTGDKEISRQEKTAVNVLHKYFEEKDQHEKSLNEVLNHNNSELDVTVAIAEHLLGKLAPGKSFEIDGRSKEKHVCKCGFQHCKKESKFGITGLGHEDVWHGFVDIIFGSHEMIEGESIATCTLGSPSQSASESTDATEFESTDATEFESTYATEFESTDATPIKKQRIDDTDEESSSSSPGGRTIAEVKKTSKGEGDQCIAETIVFSLLQKQRHPEFENHITPNIYIDQNNFRIFMYDADGDFLISTALVPLFYEGTLSPAAIICLWMVLHYRLFCTKLREGERLKSRFMELASLTREIYSNSLKFHVSSFPTQQQHNLPDILDPLNFDRDESDDKRIEKV